MHAFNAFFIAVSFAFLISLVASVFGYYRMPPQIAVAAPSIAGRQVAHVFLLFLIVQFIASPLIIQAMNQWNGTYANIPLDRLPIRILGWYYLLNIMLAVCAVFIYFYFLNKERQKVLVGKGGLSSFSFGALSYLIVASWVVAIAYLFEGIQHYVPFNIRAHQVSVEFILKIAEIPSMLLVAAIVIVCVVPCLEELMFRGFLQTWLKEKYGGPKAVVLSSLVFAAFHFSPKQGITNIEILVSLYVLSLYLGFLRLRKDSLIAPIGLHATFNLLTFINLAI